MSDRSKKMLTLALNRQLATEITSIRKRKRKETNNGEFSADPNYEPYPETKQVKSKE